ncbi:MAG: shikimate dehydrogenase [Myxococcota bacterium]
MPIAVTRAALSAKTALCGIFLHPAGHTRSPALHNAAYAALGIDAVFLAFDVTSGDLAAAIAGARAMNLRQLAISIPHKQAVMAHLDRVDETARAIGAVNTVVRAGDALVGCNTDWLGIARALERETPLAGKTAVVLGAGGTARAALYALRQRGARAIVLNRTPGKAEALARELGGARAGALEELAAIPHDVLINTTSVGLRSEASPVAAEALRAGSVVLDAVYDPLETLLLRDARARGAKPISGKWMLIEQAREQLRLWTEREVDAAVMAEAFDASSAQPPT